MENPFVENPNMRITRLFSRSLIHFRTQTTALIVYSVVKILAAIVLSSYNLGSSCQWELIDSWMVLVGVQSIVNLWCYLAIQNIVKSLNIIVKIAEDLMQTIYIPLDGDVIIPLNEDDMICPEEFDVQQNINAQEENKKISILSMQIKYEASKKNIVVKWVGQFSFVFNQFLILLGFVIEFSQPQSQIDNPVLTCRAATFIFLFIFLVLSMYQYIDLYVIFVLILICLPFVLIFLGYQMIKKCQLKRKNQDFALRLERSQRKYVPGIVAGDAECRICMSNYNLDENIIILPCNALHHFHSACISTWLKVSSSCPLCRKNFGEDSPDQIQQQLINQAEN